MAWLNSDGLYVKFGTEEGVVGKAGEYRTTGPRRFVEAKITLAGLGTTEAIQDDNVQVPKGAFIEQVDIVSTVAATSGGSATLDVGFIRTDRSTIFDDDGLAAAVALSTINATGKSQSLLVGSTGAGALIGTSLANNGLVTASYNTAAFTAGIVLVRIHYSFPLGL